MKNDKLRIVFSGTPEFAATCLDKLIEDGFNIVVVITAPDRKKGRGQSIAMSAVKETALKNNITVLQPTNLKDPEFNAELSSFNADLGVVVAFRMLPESVWDMPSLGTVNLHASLLPNYRGAAPINWVLINGESKTGLTTFFLKHEIDTGDVIKQEEVSISEDMDAGELHDLLALEGANLLSQTLRLIEDGDYEKIAQNDLISEGRILHKAPKIFKVDGEINWNDSAQKVYNKIRGLSPYPAAWTIMNKNGKSSKVKVFKANLSDIPSIGKQGIIQLKENAVMMIGTADFYLIIHEIQFEGKQKMDMASFLRGNDLSETTINNQSHE